MSRRPVRHGHVGGRHLPERRNPRRRDGSRLLSADARPTVQPQALDRRLQPDRQGRHAQLHLHVAAGEPHPRHQPWQPHAGVNGRRQHYAVGHIIDALSHSPFWDSTVVMQTEDDTQAAGDHVSSLRDYLQVSSPWAQPGPNKQWGSMPALLRTIEQIFAVNPVSIYDKLALPM